MNTILTEIAYDKTTKRKRVHKHIERIDAQTGECRTVDEYEEIGYGQQKFFQVQVAEYLTLLKNLSGNARLLIGYMFYKASRRSNLVLVKQKEAAEDLKLNKSTVERLFSELQENDAIRMKERCQWMINPEIAVGCKPSEADILKRIYFQLPAYIKHRPSEIKEDEEDVDRKDL